MTDAELLAVVREFLDGTRTASLATADGSGTPHAANVQLVRGAGLSLNVYWVSAPGSDHSRHLLDRPEAAMTVYGHDDTAGNIHGVQMRGSAAVVPAAEAWADTWDLYTRKYPVVMTMPQVREKIDAGAQSFYCLRPVWLRWIDNRRGFGWKREMAL